MSRKSIDWNVEKIPKSTFWILRDSPARKYDYLREGPVRYLYYFLSIFQKDKASEDQTLHCKVPFSKNVFYLICIKSVKNNFRLGRV